MAFSYHAFNPGYPFYNNEANDIFSEKCIPRHILRSIIIEGFMSINKDFGSLLVKYQKSLFRVLIALCYIFH